MDALNRFVTGPARLAGVIAAVLMLGACGDALGPGQDADDELLFLSTRSADEPMGSWATRLTDLFRVGATGDDAMNLTGAPAQHRVRRSSIPASDLPFAGGLTSFADSMRPRQSRAIFGT